jgi:hypothetical protein
VERGRGEVQRGLTGAEMGPDADTLYGRYDTIRTIWTTSDIETLQSDVTFSGSYEEGALELGKLMLYQLSYSRSSNRVAE